MKLGCKSLPFFGRYQLALAANILLSDLIDTEPSSGDVHKMLLGSLDSRLDSIVNGANRSYLPSPTTNDGESPRWPLGKHSTTAMASHSQHSPGLYELGVSSSNHNG